MRFRRVLRAVNGRSHTAAAALVVGVAVAAVVVLPGGAVLPSEASAAPSASDSVLLTVDSVTPLSPQRSHTNQPLQIRLSVTNQTSHTLSKVRIRAERAYPITTSSGLDRSMTDPTPPGERGLPVPATKKSAFSVGAGQTVQVTFRTTTSIAKGAGLCLCTNAVYPLFLSAHRVAKNGSDTGLGTTSTYLPVFYKAPQRLRVGWIWPIIDRPHRLTGATVFTDDDLADSVASGGRLDHLLSVLEQLPSDTPLTVLFDPETIDEIQVMTGTYRVRSGRSTSPGKGQSVASAWLERLRAALSSHPDYQVQLTPYADPDVESLTAHGLTWQTTLPAAIARRVSTALGGVDTHTDLAWPAAPRIGPRTLRSLSGSGVTAVVLNNDNIKTASDATAPIRGTARLKSGDGTVTGLLVDPTLADDVASAVSTGGAGAAALPAVMSALAVRITGAPSSPHAVTLTPPRDVDPSVSNAVDTISRTTDSPFTSPIAVPDAAKSGYLPDRGSVVRRPDSGSAGLPDSILQAVDKAHDAKSTITSLLTCSDRTNATCKSAGKLLRSIPLALQRTESSAWRQDHAGKDNPGVADARRVTSLVHRLTNGVHIVPPSSGVYTLASSNAPLPITVVNDLDYAANVKLGVSTVGGLPGFSTGDGESRVIPAGSKTTIELPATVQRTGRIRVQALLTTPEGAGLGPPVTLTVHSTALGRVGVIITIIAGILLVLALLLRAGRALGRNRRRQGLAPPGASRDSTV